MTSRELSIHRARVYLAEAARRRTHPASRNFYWQLIAWAQSCRRAAAVYREPQGDLFA